MTPPFVNSSNQVQPRLMNFSLKLVDTSESAVKHPGEAVFTSLKDELELLANLEEQHLFPVLRKHKDLRDLVKEAIQRQQSPPGSFCS